VWRRPADEFTARFLGFRNLTDAVVREGGEGVADTAWGPVPVPDGTPPGPARLLIRPSGVALTGLASAENADALRCTVRARTFRGEHVQLLLDPEHGPELQAACPLRTAPAEGARVGVVFDPADVVRLPG
jgi:thiamine transport system ATP-binding protein